ncbi:hypothetical protein GCM10010116_04200 [Microbispora rosea subsp. aerata]|nr:DUF2127 domain-containing protein [Microbispora rosea]GGO02182.1 hypothetical protein GCM10010116_04200 [Microbispora rosea subsp. aerata]GIH54679.1 hypothetical protein Mro02_15930 [Microbispora rosea subsp. aerata]GLJ85798.1 hypothetical protein GCM10017588_45310 [Microbispora rosea subsp. aerata]
MDWSLRACGRHGHVTYAPDEEALRSRLRAETALGEAWRCLRCGDFTLGPPRGAGPARDAPVVLRGRALRDAAVLRFIAVFRWAKAVLVLAGAYGVWRFRDHHDAVRRAFDQDLPLIRPLARQIGWNLDHSGVVHTLRTVLGARTTTLTWIFLALLVLAALLLTEGTGLWLLKRWGEYFSVIVTSAFIPVEVYEIAEKASPVRIAILLVNVAAVMYIALSKRLFGLRGGRTAHEAERHEASLLEVEEAGLAVTERDHRATRPSGHP